MNRIFTYFFLLFIFILQPSTILAEGTIFKLESHQKLTGTFSGDIDQENSVHLMIFKDKDAGNYGIIPFFINAQDELISLEHIQMEDEPSVVSFHFNPSTSNLTLLLKQGRRTDKQLEIIDLNINSNTISKSQIEDYEDAYLVIREKNRSFLIIKEKDNLEINTIFDSQRKISENFSFKGENKSLFNRIFETTPETINTNEYVKNGSINPSKVYFYNDRLIFDHISEEKYTTLSINPEDNSHLAFSEFELKGVNKVRDINSFIFKSKAFLFINNKEDINLRSYDLETGEMIKDLFLQQEFSHYFDSEILEKLIKKSSRKANRLTGTVNEGPENSMVVTMDFVSARNYFYHYNWWWHHQFLHQQMMWQNQMMQQHMQMNTFGPNPDSYMSEIFPAANSQSVKLLIDKDLNVLAGKDVLTLRPEIDKEKHIEKFQNDRKVKNVTLAFTRRSGRAVYFSKETDLIHVKTFDL
ncbi:hypothetical protein V6B16_08780 [Salinimicrobium catena]|uniref:hypothetical protein n=1 Tax=Salinimicrobium catena TaxID=390640 RepID=UPI002FE45F1E